MAPLPTKPQSVLIERWLPYNDNIKRRVVFQKAPADPVVIKPRNVIVQWEAPHVSVKKENKFLGIVRANPAEYVQRYGSSLKTASELPQFVLDIKSPDGIVLASDYRYRTIHELEGDVDALKLVDLDREGLSEYKEYLERYVLTSSNNTSNTTSHTTAITDTSESERKRNLSTVSNSVESVIEEIFKSIDVKNTGSIDIDEAARILLRLNSRLGYGENGVKALFSTLGENVEKTVTLADFKRAFLNLQL
jgi:hypothetical protein